MKINPERAVKYCQQLIDKRCHLCNLGATLDETYRHLITISTRTLKARCHAQEIWKEIKDGFESEIR